jgi:curved DNA-binding protein CbpA
MVMAKLKDYYQVLGVPPRSHVRVIEDTYWERAHELQKQPTRKAAKRLSALNEAYETLGSPHRRELYDQQRLNHEANGHSSNGGGFLQLVVNLIGKPFRPD